MLILECLKAVYQNDVLVEIIDIPQVGNTLDKRLSADVFSRF